MGRELRVDGPRAAMPPNRFEVDLTSVCVRRGAVQLPYRLRGAFTEGPVPAADADGGAALVLRFRPPRELLGLQAFFEAHGLRANDRIGLVFTDDGLTIEAMKRERPPADRGRGAGASGASPGRTAAPAEARSAPSGTQAQQRSAGPQPVPPPRRAAGGTVPAAASSAPPSLRMDTPPPSEPAAGPSAAPRWEPLDVLSSGPGGARSAPGPGRSEEAGAHDEAETTVVREVRRSSGPGRAASAAPAPSDREPRERPGSRDARQPVTERPDEDRPPRPVQGRGLDLFGLRRRLGFGRGEPARNTLRAEGPTSEVGPASEEGFPGASRSPAGGSARGEAAGGVPGGAPAVDGEAASADAGPSGPGPAGAGTRERPARPAAGAMGPVAESVAAVAEGPLTQGSLDEQIRAVSAYLERPGLPAVVRAERVAQDLGLSLERADAALDRIAEGSESLSVIRAGAYMLRGRSER